MEQLKFRGNVLADTQKGFGQEHIFLCSAQARQPDHVTSPHSGLLKTLLFLSDCPGLRSLSIECPSPWSVPDGTDLLN